MKFSNILKIGDVDYQQIPTELIGWLREHGEPTYRDTVLKEHIYNIENILEGIENGENEAPGEDCVKHLRDISKLMAKKNLGYFRIVFP